jgi:hypothetical protein
MNAPLKKMPATPVADATADRVAALDWTKLSEQLDGFGNAVIEGLLTPDECRAVSSRVWEGRVQILQVPVAGSCCRLTHSTLSAPGHGR